MEKVAIFVPLTKVDVAKRLVYGTAVMEKPDRVNEIFDYASSKPYIEAWSNEVHKTSDGKSKGNLRAMHNKIAAGKLTELVCDDVRKAVDVVAEVVDDDEWKKVEAGVYTGFSIGGKYVRKWADPDQPGMKRYTADPVEMSLADLPQIPGTTFEIQKADGSSELRKFATVEETPIVISNEQVATKATELAKAAGPDKKWSDYIDAARTELEAAAKPAPAVVEKNVQSSAETAPAAAAAAGDPDEVGKQVWVNDRLPGKSFEKKADLRKALVDLDASDTVEKTVRPAKDALAAVSAALNKAEGIQAVWNADADVPEDLRKSIPAEALTVFREAANRQLGKAATIEDATKAGMAVVEAAWTKGADGKWIKKVAETAPVVAVTVALPGIADKDALKKSIGEYAAATNKNALRRHLVKCAKTLNATEILPADWQGSTDAKAEKSQVVEMQKLAGGDLKKAVSLYGVANFLQLLASVESIEESCEYQDMWPNATNLPKALCDRFGAVVVELGDIAAEMLDLLVAGMRAEEAREALERSAPIIDLMKIGARNSKSDTTRLNKAHDLLVECGAQCTEANDAAKSAGGDELAKMAAVNVGLQTTIAEMAGTLTKMAERVSKLDEMSETVKRIEAQPVPRPNARVVEKTADGLSLGGDVQKTSEILRDPATLSVLADAANRLAHQHPQTMLPKSS